MSFKLFNSPNYYIIELGKYQKELSVQDDLLDIDSFLISTLDGFAITDRRIITGETKRSTLESISLHNLANGHGEWLALAERRTGTGNEYLFFGDRFGYSPIFYSTASDSSIVVSNSFHGVVLGLEKLGISRTLNIPYYATLIASNAPTFQNSHLFQTMSNEILLLPADFGLLIKKNKISFISRDVLGRINDIGEYEDAIKLGVDYASSMLARLSSSENLNARITLTGGVDSRLCASLAAKSDSLSNFKISTIDPRTWAGKRGQKSINRDMVLSNRIRREFDLSWWAMPNRRKISMEFRESLGAFQSYRSNLAFTFVPNPTHTRFADTTLTIRGGGGEILRVDATIEKIAAEFESERQGLAPQVLDEGLWYATYILRGSLLKGHLRELAINDIVEDFPYGYGDSFLERISKLYLDHRYRGHFGHQRQSTSANDIILHPLSNPYFLKASKLLSFEKLSAGILVRNLFDETCPRMLEFTFANDEWSEILTASVGVDSEYYSQEWVEEYDSAHTPSVSTFDFGNDFGDRRESLSFDAVDSSLSYLLFAFADLARRVPMEYQVEIRNLQKLALSKVRSGQFIAGYMVAKAASALDCFYAAADIGNLRRLTCFVDLVEPESLQVPLVDTRVLSLPLNGVSNLEVPAVRVDIRCVDSTLFVLVNSALGVTESLEFAYYIYRDGIRILTKWYDKDSFLTLNVYDSPGTYFVEVFVRMVKNHQLIGKFRTSNLVID